MTANERVLGYQSVSTERIRLFVKFPGFLETSYLAGPSLHFQSNATPPVFEDFLEVRAGDFPCITTDKVTRLKPPALAFKCSRSPAEFIISPNNDRALAQRQDLRELLTQVGDLPLGKTDVSLKAYATVLPGNPGVSRTPSFQSNRKAIQSERSAMQMLVRHRPPIA
jgi:hypothetical protein